MKYRADIDGLRAIAVLPVVLYHAGFGFPGGFVGVDVFFVISGYLITSLILKDADAGAFSLVTFWERRVRRILPPLLPVLAATFVVGWYWMLPTDFQNLGGAIASQSLMMTNIWFWTLGGYFNPTADTEPLLHLWSLAVEEQFYLLFPLLLVALRRFRISTVGTLIVLAAGSFALSAVGVFVDASATFYLMPTRAWELLLGSLLCLTPTLKPERQWLAQLAAPAGIAMILAVSWTYTKSTPFPGVAALPPCLGAALVIWAGSGTPTLTGHLLAAFPLRSIGLISYSLYLWHWPPLAFARYLSFDPLSSQLRALLLGASFVLAIASWFLIERPLRQKWILPSRRAILTAGALASLLVLVTGLGTELSGGVPGRVSPRIATYAAAVNDREYLPEIGIEDVRRDTLYELDPELSGEPIHCLLWGDSHAKAVVPALRPLAREHRKRCVAACYSGTAPLLDYVSANPYSLKERCPEYSEAIVDYVRRKRVPHVLIVGFWVAYPIQKPAPDQPSPIQVGLEKTVDALQEAGAKVWIMRQVPIFPQSVPRVLGLATMRNVDPVPLYRMEDWHNLSLVDYDPIFQGLEKKGAIKLDPAPLFVRDGLCTYLNGDHPMYIDAHHLSLHGAEHIRPLFEPLFEEASSDIAPKSPTVQLAP